MGQWKRRGHNLTEILTSIDNRHYDDDDDADTKNICSDKMIGIGEKETLTDYNDTKSKCETYTAMTRTTTTTLNVSAFQLFS